MSGGLEATEEQAALELAAAEIEEFVGRTGWDQRPTLFALVRAAAVARDEPETAARLGLDETAELGHALVPIEQEALSDAPLDEALGRVAWPGAVTGCAVSQEIVILPPGADDDLAADAPTTADLAAAAAHPQRREARLVVAVLRDGSRATLLRLRPPTDGTDDDELLVGPDLAPNLAAALLATLEP